MTKEYQVKTENISSELGGSFSHNMDSIYSQVNIIESSGTIQKVTDYQYNPLIGAAVFTEIGLVNKSATKEELRELYIQHQKDGTEKAIDFFIDKNNNKIIKQFTFKPQNNNLTLEPITVKTCTTASLEVDEAKKYAPDKEGLGVALEKALVTNIIYHNIKKDIENNAVLGTPESRIKTSLGKERYEVLSDETKKYVTKLSVEVQKIAQIPDKKGMLNTLKRWWDQRKFSKLVNNKQQKNQILAAIKTVKKVPYGAKQIKANVPQGRINAR